MSMEAPGLVILEAVFDPGDAAPPACSDDAATAVTRLNHLDIRVALVTTTPAASGYREIGDHVRANAAVHRAFSERGALVEALFFCPHRPGESCDCRPPSPRLLLAACRRFCTEPARTGAVALTRAFDRAARRLGISVVQLRTSLERSDEPGDPVTTMVEAVERLVMPQEKGRSET